MKQGCTWSKLWGAGYIFKLPVYTVHCRDSVNRSWENSWCTVQGISNIVSCEFQIKIKVKIVITNWHFLKISYFDLNPESKGGL